MATTALVPDTRRYDPERRSLEALFLTSLPAIGHAVDRLARRYRLAPWEREDFRGEVHVAFIQNDYHILDCFQGQSSLHTYVAIVVKRRLIDYQRRRWGRWNRSSAARKLGPAGPDLEFLIHGERRPVSEAIGIVGAATSIADDELAAIAARLPVRPSRLPAGEDALANLPAGTWSDPERVLGADTTMARVRDALHRVMTTLPAEDRVVLREHFGRGSTLAAIARAHALDQKRLYRRVKRLLGRLRQALESRGITWPMVGALIDGGRCEVDLGS